MTLSRQLRRARGLHRRTIPDGAAALIFTREPDGDADVLEVHYLHPKGAPTNGEHTRLAQACAEYARELLTDEESDGTQTTGAEGAADDAGQSGADGGRDGQG